LFNGSGTNKLRAAYEMALRQSKGYLKEKAAARVAQRCS
jgi:hypothetical protein